MSVFQVAARRQCSRLYGSLDNLAHFLHSIRDFLLANLNWENRNSLRLNSANLNAAPSPFLLCPCAHQYGSVGLSHRSDRPSGRKHGKLKEDSARKPPIYFQGHLDFPGLRL